MTRSLKNIDKNKEIPVEANTLLEKRLSNPGGREHKNNVIVTGVSENDDKLQFSLPTQAHKLGKKTE